MKPYHYEILGCQTYKENIQKFTRQKKDQGKYSTATLEPSDQWGAVFKSLNELCLG